MDNRTVADRLLTYARLLDDQAVNVYRPRAYRQAAETVLRLGEPISHLVDQGGKRAVAALPGIGGSLAETIVQLVRDGSVPGLDGPEALTAWQQFATIPGIGRRLARRIHDDLQLKSLEELEQAARCGALAQVGIGPKRLAGILAALTERLALVRFPQPPAGEPTVALLLEIDQAYQHEAARCHLPGGAVGAATEASEVLPLHASERDGWRFRATRATHALAHRLGRAHDWVIIHFSDGSHVGQRMIVTETNGLLRGQRVVRGREAECLARSRGHGPTERARA